MALKLYNGTNHEDMIGSSAFSASGTVAVTTTGITSSGATAPNLVNAATGALIYITSVPSVGNYTLEVMESGVSKKTATLNLADMKPGYNYGRFATTYTFATLTASAYTCRVKNTSANSGTIATATANLWFEFSYNTSTSPAVGDDVFVVGFQDAGMTTVTWAYSGTAGSFGSGTDTAIAASTSRTMGAALMIGNGIL